jgi:hypothetical protein
MNNFIIGMFVGMITVGVVIIIVDQLRGRGFNLNFFDILAGIYIWIREKMVASATKFAERRVARDYAEQDEYYAKHYKYNSERLDAMDKAVVESDTDEGDEDMAYIDSMVDFCEGRI